MNFTVKEKRSLTYVKGTDDMKFKYLIEDADGRKYYVLNWIALQVPIVYDYEYDNRVGMHSWHPHPAYAFSKKAGYMHRIIAEQMGITNEDNPNLSVDHINGCKLDNRKKNLRMATQSEQIVNRSTRSDKKPPCEELQAIGVKELPRYVRWDSTEQKFIIEKHPKLMEEVASGNRKKATMSGSKSQKIIITEKYQDIIVRLEELDCQYDSQFSKDFQQLKQKNLDEYNQICKCIEMYEGTYVENNEPVEAPLTTLVPSRRTANGKKSSSKLPPDCGVRHEDVPRYCYYQQASDTRGDKFVIDKHPALVAQGKRQWATPEKRTLTTKDKFDMLIDKYNELENFCQDNIGQETSHGGESREL